VRLTDWVGRKDYTPGLRGKSPIPDTV
jgi:hypothetical protein